MNAPQVVIYGASGYTGKHVAWKLSEKGIPFIAAGRNKQRLEQQLKAMPELAGAQYEVVAVGHDEAELGKLFAGKAVVCNMVGPYMQLGAPVVNAALAAGCHYLDCTGEQDWMLHLKREYAAAFAAKGLCLLPATAAMWTQGMTLAELVLETAGIDSLDITYTLAGVPSVSSTLSFMRMCCQTQYFLQNKQLVAWPPATGVSIAVPGIHKIMIATPWSGGGEAVWFENDARVRNCSTLVTFGNQALMDMVIARMKEFNEKYMHLPQAEQEAVTNKWAMEIAPQGEPPREDFNVHRALLCAHGRGTLVSRSIAVWGATGYVMTGVITSATIDTLLRGQQKATGFAPAVHVVGIRRMLAELMDNGVWGKPKDVIG